MVRARLRQVGRTKPALLEEGGLGSGGASVATLLVFERHLELGSEQLDLAVFELHVLRRDLGDAQVAERLRRALDGGPRRLLPRLAARADEFDDFVDAVGHALLPKFQPGDRRTPVATWRAGSRRSRHARPLDRAAGSSATAKGTALGMPAATEH